MGKRCAPSIQSPTSRPKPGQAGQSYSALVEACSPSKSMLHESETSRRKTSPGTAKVEQLIRGLGCLPSRESEFLSRAFSLGAPCRPSGRWLGLSVCECLIDCRLGGCFVGVQQFLFFHLPCGSQAQQRLRKSLKGRAGAVYLEKKDLLTHQLVEGAQAGRQTTVCRIELPAFNVTQQCQSVIGGAAPSRYVSRLNSSSRASQVLSHSCVNDR